MNITESTPKIHPSVVVPPSRDEAAARLRAQQEDEARQKAELLARYEADAKREDELDRTLKAAQDKRNAFLQSMEEANAANASIAAQNVERVARRKRLFIRAGMLIAAGIVIHAAIRLVMVGW